METHKYSDYNNLTDNFGGVVVYWMRKVLEIKSDKSSGSVKNEQSENHHIHRNPITGRNNERLERKMFLQ